MTAALSDKPTEDSSGMDLLNLRMGPDMNANEKECTGALLAETGDAEVVGRLISAALDGSLQVLSVWRLLQEVKEKPNAQKLLLTSKYIDVLFKPKSLILETISDITLLEQGLDAMDHGTEQVRSFCRAVGEPMASWSQFNRLWREF